MFVKNRTSRVIAVSYNVDGIERTLSFAPCAVTPVDDAVDLAFRESGVYRSLFLGGELEYSARATEVRRDRFCKSLARYEVKFEPLRLHLWMSRRLAGSRVVVKHSVDGGEVVAAEPVVVGADGYAEVDIGLDVNDNVEFVVYNDYSGDFVFVYSDRIKVFKG